MLTTIQPKKARSRRAAHTGRRWSVAAGARSDAMTLEPGVFTKPTAHAIAASLKQSAVHSRRRKTTPLRSAMSMLNFYINRIGVKLPPARRKVLEKAKVDLREMFRKPAYHHTHH